MTKTVLVTGGCGFIGVNFVRLLLSERQDWRVINLDKLTYAGNLQSLADVSGHPNYTFIKGDICDAALLDRLFREQQIDTVAHFAAES
ncbi:GDP-mannose 4,6-dehydratase, partial [Desulfobulbus sp. F4]|nr:GDP-mannose 4,6-dehydratase [Desulfobulbus sp. F4]